MTPRSRTNQLLYQAELLLEIPAGGDEHREARRMAVEEGALALIELALESLLREVTEHALLEQHDWRELLGSRKPTSPSCNDFASWWHAPIAGFTG